jgi:hypothetical protein
MPLQLNVQGAQTSGLAEILLLDAWLCFVTHTGLRQEGTIIVVLAEVGSAGPCNFSNVALTVGHELNLQADF